MEIAIRAEAKTERAALRNLLLASFPTAAEADLVDRLTIDGDVVLSLVAAKACRIVGAAIFSRMSGPFPALGLAPVAVDEEERCKGIADKLIRAGLEEAQRQGITAVFVLGDPAYYSRFGFRPKTAAGFASPYAGPYLMALALHDAGLPVTSGRIDYAPAFNALEA
ncbi:MAG: N-acetyltransferase [Rhodobiaceae bacterium]|nr:N-acetyltransferase [Rhodobiaceae bacterium]MCC0057488.1 N-acetyltransferase [Rhodobiaceae bacterium]